MQVPGVGFSVACLVTFTQGIMGERLNPFQVAILIPAKTHLKKTLAPQR